MSANNMVILHGKIASEVILSGAEGKERTSFTLAVKKPYKVKEGEKDADFIRIQAWGKTAKSITSYVGKGCDVLIQGSIVTGSYQDADGKTVYTTDVKVDDIKFITFKEPKEGQADAPAAQPSPQNQAQSAKPQPEQMSTSQLQAAADALSDEDIPF